MEAEEVKLFGETILEKVNLFFEKQKVNRDDANDYLDNNPDVQEALDWKAQRILGSPLLAAYYGSIGTIEGYIKSEMYSEISVELGSDFMDVIEDYNYLKTYGTEEEVKAFYKLHKADFKRYYAIMDQYQAKIDRAISTFSAHIPDVNAKVRQDYNPFEVSQGAQQLEQGLAPQQVRSMEEWQAILSPEMTRIIVSHLENQDPLDYDIQTRFDRIAYDLGYEDGDSLVQAVGTSLYSGK
jgi:hypothetical protein